MEYQACTQICLQVGVFVALACIVCAWHLLANHSCQNLFFNQSSESFNQKSLKTYSQVLSLYCNGGSQGDTGTTAKCHICSEGHGVENMNYNFWKTKSSKSLLNQRLAVLPRYSAWTCLSLEGSFAHQRLRAWGCIAGRRSSSFIFGVFCHLATEAHERWEFFHLWHLVTLPHDLTVLRAKQCKTFIYAQHGDVKQSCSTKSWLLDTLHPRFGQGSLWATRHGDEYLQRGTWLDIT